MRFLFGFSLLISLTSAASLRAPLRREDLAHSTSVKFISKLAKNPNDPYKFRSINGLSDGGASQIYTVAIKVEGKDFEVSFRL